MAKRRLIQMSGILFLLFLRPVAGQDPNPPPPSFFDGLETRLEANGLFDTQAKMERVSLDFRADITLNSKASVTAPTDDVWIEFVAAVSDVEPPPPSPNSAEHPPPTPPSAILFIPRGCFRQKGNHFQVTDPVSCGVRIMRTFGDNSNMPPIDITPGLVEFEAKLAPVPGRSRWNLRVAASFFDIRQTPVGPSFLQSLAGAERTIVQIGNDMGRTLPHAVEVTGSADVVSLP